ncbi:MYND-type domain-containing protein [Mycena indigotica]|uniref:MYND-type domain-containing protein n=1 Tax=Mycena indigotica TaxID=2126181 RepID=A0A8H6S1E3_9AGAR|nr:MYND-type domain-containing protein [Mycena indigotica]KAF7290662.1 MYND-type domain-containing protein [Mycena indigotica]
MACTCMTAEDFAVLLDLIRPEMHSESRSRPEEVVAPPLGQEFERNYRTKTLLNHIAGDAHNKEQKLIVWSTFSAKYLPQMVDRLLNLPTPMDNDGVPVDYAQDYVPCSPWYYMLLHIQYTPYLYKYLHSPHPLAASSKQLPQVMADRLADAMDRWDGKLLNTRLDREMRGYYLDIVEGYLAVLNTLCVAFIRVEDRSTIINEATKKRLTTTLVDWMGRYRDERIGRQSKQLCMFLSGLTNWDEWFHDIRRHYKNWEVCGFANCNTRQGLKACKRCQTVRYCSAEHQRFDWIGMGGIKHKHVCFETEY